MVWEQFTDHLQVLWGALSALAIVLVLTPAVGRAARYLRLADRPSEGVRARHEIPRLDGLAAGVCAISGATFAIIELSLGRVGAAILAAIVCGACLGFLRHNFYPARIFMGDSGALLLGYTLAAISVQGLLKTAALATLLLPLLVLAVPVLDTSFVVAKRLKSGQPVYLADARHLHHRFMRIGFSERRSVVYLWTWCGTLALAALATRFAPPHHHGDWDATNAAIDAAAGLLAVAFSLYVVYVLEIVKLAS